MIVATLWISQAFGAGGAYMQLGGGGGWSDLTGPLVRGGSSHIDLGGYAGPYRGSMRYGKYTRGGLRIEAQEQSKTIGLLIGPSMGRGVDLMNVGAWASISPGVLVTGLEDSDDISDWNAGLGVRGEAGALYNVAPAFGIGLRFQMGLNFVDPLGDDARTSLSFGLGLSFLIRVPVVRPRDEDH